VTCAARGVANKNASSQIAHASDRTRFIDIAIRGTRSLPELKQPAIEPVPQEVSHELRLGVLVIAALVMRSYRSVAITRMLKTLDQRPITTNQA
jgi:hypothetical protein